MNLEKIKLVLLVIIAALVTNVWWSMVINPKHEQLKVADNMERYMLSELLTLTPLLKKACDAENPLVIVPAYQMFKGRFQVLRNYVLSKKDEKFGFIIDSVDGLGKYIYQDDNANGAGCKKRVEDIENELNALSEAVDK